MTKSRKTESETETLDYETRKQKTKVFLRKMGHVDLKDIFDDPIFLAQHRKAVWVFEGAINWIMSKLGSMMIVVDKEGLKDPNPYIGVRAILAPELLRVDLLARSKQPEPEEKGSE